MENRGENKQPRKLRQSTNVTPISIRSTAIDARKKPATSEVEKPNRKYYYPSADGLTSFCRMRLLIEENVDFPLLLSDRMSD
jgi:hypothetical protein